MHIKNWCGVVHYKLCILWPVEQDVGRRNIFENKWGTKARILVMVGGGHAALVRRCLIYRGSGRGSGQNPQRPGVRNLGDLARILEGPGGSKVSLFDSAVFGHCYIAGGLPVLTLSVCHSL